ncbi:hypothetical protein [Marinactinospora rubrisoli]|uniref:Secreted protein n=1 Tax=Marinactinospora rubrisoli TaxID=2715399 RepID=A0ABW2K9L0_9ACTN
MDTSTAFAVSASLTAGAVFAHTLLARAERDRRIARVAELLKRNGPELAEVRRTAARAAVRTEDLDRVPGRGPATRYHGRAASTLRAARQRSGHRSARRR